MASFVHGRGVAVRLVVCIVVACAGLAFLLAGAAARRSGSGRPVWSAQILVGAASFGSVSCPSSTRCIALSGTRLVGWWDGRRWSIQTSPRVPGGRSPKLNAPSCPSPATCVAVGDFWRHVRNGNVIQVPLVERWEGGHWSFQAPPFPHGSARNHLYFVSCASRRACTALGLARGTYFADHWDGKRWSLYRLPIPSDVAKVTTFNALSCGSSSACIAVGTSYPSVTGTVMLAEHWNGKQWLIQTPPASEGLPSQLFGVSCTSPRACTAVGNYNTTPDGSGPSHTLAERWNGTRWMIQTTPNANKDNGLLGVSCASSTACTAVGYSDKYPGSYAPGALAERWDGTRWSIQRTPRLSPQIDLAAVSCASSRACTAVGILQKGALVEQWPNH